jgi:2'-hydroxyisoflavone reductase
MKNDRREFIKAGVFGSAVVAAGLPMPATAEQGMNARRPLEILILGGTGFIGPHMVREALRRGHKLTLFNRGRTNSRLFPDLETIQGDRDGGLDGLVGRRWDAVVDNSGYVPRHVADSASLLAPNIDRYLYISSVSVYADFSIANDENAALATMADESIETVTGETYGPLKALCETKARAAVVEDQLTVIRPTFICGPGDRTDRFSYWPIRTREGGDMIWPGKPADAISVVDVRDLANFTIDCLDNAISGTFNAVNPAGSYTMGDLLADSRAVTGADVEPLWVDEDFITANKLSRGNLLPIWQSSTGETAGFGLLSGKAARKAGLHNRPERETMRDLLTWWDTLDEGRRANIRAGLPADREAELIAKWLHRTHNPE